MDDTTRYICNEREKSRVRVPYPLTQYQKARTRKEKRNMGLSFATGRYQKSFLRTLDSVGVLNKAHSDTLSDDLACSGAL